MKPGLSKILKTILVAALCASLALTALAGCRKPAAVTDPAAEATVSPADAQESAAEVPVKLWINTRWLADTGLPMPATVEELENVLLQFKGDMNGNGLYDEIPMTAAYQGGGLSTLGPIISAFCPTGFDLSNDFGYLSVDSTGKVYTEVTGQNFQAALKYLKRLVDEGVLDPNLFTNTRQELLAGSASAEVYGVIPAPDLGALWNDTDRAAAYEPIPALTSAVYERADSTPYPQLVFSQADTARLTQNGSDARAEVMSYLVSSCQAFVTGEMNLDADWNTYINTLYDKGLGNILSAAQNALDAYQAANG